MSSRTMSLRLSVVIPAYNEVSTIRTVLERVSAVPEVSEIIVVDDASTDATRELLSELAARLPFKRVRNETNRGKGASVREGFRVATGDVVVVQDADLEYDPAEYPNLLRPIERGEAD